MGVVSSIQQQYLSMSKLFLVLAALLMVASAAPNPKTQCPMDAIFACVGEVSAAWTPAGMLETSWAASRGSLGLLTAGTVPVMSSPGWDSWTARWAHQKNYLMIIIMLGLMDC